MPSYRVDNLAVSIEKDGAKRFAKASYPIRFGKYSEISTPDYEFQFNLTGDIKFIRGLHAKWRHPAELLKRTDGNDWVFYSLGSVGQKIVSWLGEYYLPFLPYPSNSFWEYNPFTDPTIMTAFGAWSQLYANLCSMRDNGLPGEVKEFLDLVRRNDETALHEKANRLRSIMGGRPSVLPPDTRHVDYEIIPLMVADGCLYHCDFCCVKSPRTFTPRTRDDISGQLRRLKDFYGRNSINYKGLFLGNHDALAAGRDLLSMAASQAIEALRMDAPEIFLFGSVDSLLRADGQLFDDLSKISSYTYINIGLESVDAATLALIQKPLRVAKVKEAFQRMLELNQAHANLAVTANFLLGENLSPGHYQSLAELLGGVPDHLAGKGAVYLSPMMASRNRLALLDKFYEIQKASRLPAYVYLIQRL